jgi:phosphoglucosamine mutase
MHKYFGTDGIRGRVGEFPITPEFALKLGYAAGMVLGRLGANPTVIIAKDTRLSGYLFESSLEAGFSYAGVNVYMAGPIPTPAVAYLTKTLRLSSGVVISASHNPYYDNGIKFFSPDGYKLLDSVEEEIELQLEKPLKYMGSLGKVSRLEDVKGRYIEFCKNTFPGMLSLRGLKIVVDCANGATYQVAPTILQELGATVVAIHAEPDGININHECGSTHPESLVKAVVEHQADLGIAFDGDGDRVVFVDSKGTLYNGDKLLYIIARLYQSNGMSPKGVVGTVMSNMALEIALKRDGIELLRAKVGDRYVLERLKEKSWVLGGEASGHLLCLDKHTTGDGIIAALQVLAALITFDKTLTELITWEDYPQVLINVRLSGGRTWDEAATDKVVVAARQDLGDTGRIIVRTSGTEPVVRVMVEAKDALLAKGWAEKIAGAIK